MNSPRYPSRGDLTALRRVHERVETFDAAWDERDGQKMSPRQMIGTLLVVFVVCTVLTVAAINNWWGVWLAVVAGLVFLVGKALSP